MQNTFCRVVCSAERSQVPDRMDEPALLPVDSVEDHFLMDTGSYDEVQHLNQQFTLYLVTSC